MIASLERFATGRRLIMVLAILIACSALNFGLGPYEELAQWGGGARLLDMQPAADSEQAIRVLAAYGSEGRERYLEFLAFDTVFLVINAIALSFLAAFALARLTARLSWRALALLPLAVGVLDLIENVGIFALLSGFPRDLLASGAWLGLVTATKLALVPVVFLALVVAWSLLTARSLWSLRARPTCR